MSKGCFSSPHYLKHQVIIFRTSKLVGKNDLKVLDFSQSTDAGALWSQDPSPRPWGQSTASTV